MHVSSFPVMPITQSDPVGCYLYAEDIPGASLKGRQPNDLTVPELKRWLSFRAGTVRGTKADFVKR